MHDKHCSLFCDERYRKNVAIPEIGSEGQKRLMESSILIIGVGGVGCPATLYLAGLGVGRLGLADGDVVSLDNLNRQVLYGVADVGKPKVEVAREAVSRLSPYTKTEIYSEFLDEQTIERIASNYDFVIDAADGLQTKLAIARACARVEKPHCHAAIGGFLAQVMTCLPKDDTFNALFGASGLMEARFPGSFSISCGVAGVISAGEAIKYVLGCGRLLTEEVFCFNAKTGGVSFFAVDQ